MNCCEKEERTRMDMGRTDFRIHLNILAETDLQDIVPVVQTLQYNLM